MGGIEYTIQYHHRVVLEDVAKLDRQVKQRIRRAIEGKLLTEPELFGKPLRKSLKGYRSLRVGDYRVIFFIKQEVITVISIRHRTEAYPFTLERLNLTKFPQ